jgi:hypothetical protein
MSVFVVASKAPVVAIIGTSETGAGAELSDALADCVPPGPADLFDRMVERSAALIEGRFKCTLADVQLVSGGAAWGDHVAVALFLKGLVAGLTLYLPCEWVTGSNPSHLTKGKSRSWKTNPGLLANERHMSFSDAIGRDTLKEIEAARLKGARIITDYRGFHRRNYAVAQAAARLIAFTWGVGYAPSSRGTLDTWNKARCEKVHVSLAELACEKNKTKKK